MDIQESIEAIPAAGPAAAATQMEPDCADTIPQQSLCLDQLAPDYLLPIYEYLTPLDMANASEASDHLANFATAHIYRKFADCRIFVRRYMNLYEWPEFEIILRHFGAHIKRIKLNADCLVDASQKHVALVMQQCPQLDVIHLANFYFTTDALQDVQCSAKRIILDNFHILIESPNLLQCCPKATALSIYRPSINRYDQIRDMLQTISALERFTLIDAMAQHTDVLNDLQKHRDSLCCIALINITFMAGQSPRYNNLAGVFPKLDQLQIGVASTLELDALAGMTVKYLQLKRESPSDVAWSLQGLPLLEELDLVEMEDRIVLNVPSVRVFSTEYSDRIQEHVSKLPHLNRLRLRNFRFELQVLDRLFETNCKETEIELEHTAREEITKLLRYLDQRSSAKKDSPLLVRIICSKSEFKLLDTKTPANVRWASADYCKQTHRFEPLLDASPSHLDVGVQQSYYDYDDLYDDVFDDEADDFDYYVEDDGDYDDELDDYNFDDGNDYNDDTQDLDEGDALDDVESDQDILDDINAAIDEAMDDAADDILAEVNIDGDDLDDPYHNDHDHLDLDDSYQNDLDDLDHIDFDDYE